jgi:thiamine biosynthesis protein ThiS
MRQSEICVIVNGETRRVRAGFSVADVLAATPFKPTQVVVEHNGNVLDRNRLGEVALEDGDRLEIVIPVAGG